MAKTRRIRPVEPCEVRARERLGGLLRSYGRTGGLRGDYGVGNRPLLRTQEPRPTGATEVLSVEKQGAFYAPTGGRLRDGKVRELLDCAESAPRSHATQNPIQIST